jgi:fucose permease
LQLTASLRTGLFWTGSLSFVLIGVVQSIYGPVIPTFARSFGISTAEAGLFISAHSAGGLAGLLASAALGSVSARQALGILAAGAALIAVGFSWWLTLFGALVLGAGYGFVSAVVNRRFLTEMESGAAMVGIVNAIYGIGAIAGPLLFVSLGARADLAFGLIAVTAVALIPFARGAALPVAAVGGFFGLVRRPGILILGACAIGIEISMVGFGPSALAARGITGERAAELASLFFVFFLVARASLYWIAALMRPLSLLTLSFLSAAALNGLASVVAPGMFYALAGASCGTFFPAYFVAASSLLGTDGRAAAMILAAVYLGAILLPAALSGLIALFGASVVFPALAIFALFSALATVVYAGRA